jgi:hypothetical protein
MDIDDPTKEHQYDQAKVKRRKQQATTHHQEQQQQQ